MSLINTNTVAKLTLVGIFTGSLLINVLWLQDMRESLQKLDICAQTNNVYECVYVPTPAEPHRVEYRQAAILPPPAI